VHVVTDASPYLGAHDFVVVLLALLTRCKLLQQIPRRSGANTRSILLILSADRSAVNETAFQRSRLAEAEAPSRRPVPEEIRSSVVTGIAFHNPP
jgi:hypothetical protein